MGKSVGYVQMGVWGTARMRCEDDDDDDEEMQIASSHGRS